MSQTKSQSSPTSPSTAFKISEKIKDPMQMYLSDIFTVPASLAGIPAMSIPIGFDNKGLPMGMQLMANYFKENDIFKTVMSIFGFCYKYCSLKRIKYR